MKTAAEPTRVKKCQVRIDNEFLTNTPTVFLLGCAGWEEYGTVDEFNKDIEAGNVIIIDGEPKEFVLPY